MYKKGYKSNNIRGKLKVYRYLSESNMKRLVPHSKLLTKENLEAMAKKYQSLYIKPDVGSLGNGIFKLVRLQDGYNLFYIRNRKQVKKRCKTLSAAYAFIKSKRKERMLVQQAIKLDEVNGRPYDIRAMVQRKPKRTWACTGFLVKVGAEKKIVTNYYQGGKIITIESLLKEKGLTSDQRKSKIMMLKNRALDVAKALSKKRSGMHEMGIDFAFSQKQRLWLLEVNSNHPQFHPLKKLDPKAYERMMDYARSYGRTSAK